MRIAGNCYGICFRLGIAVALALTTAACSTTITPPDGGDGGPVSFADDIQPILTAKCAGCHSPGGIADLSGVPLYLRTGESYDNLVSVTSFQNADLTLVVPSDSSSSLLYLKVSSNNPPVGARMPLFAPALSSSQIQAIRDWIDQGAENN